MELIILWPICIPLAAIMQPNAPKHQWHQLLSAGLPPFDGLSSRKGRYRMAIYTPLPDIALSNRTQLTTIVQQIIHDVQQDPNLKEMITNTTQELIMANPLATYTNG